MIDPSKFEALAADLRDADFVLKDAQQHLESARKRVEAAAAERAQRKSAICSYVDTSAGARLWP